MSDKQEHLEQEVLQYRYQVSALQERLDSVTKVRDGELNDIAPLHLSHVLLLHFLINFSPFHFSLLQEFDMSAEELSETLAQIKAFRMQQESRMGLSFLSDDGKVENTPQVLASMQASHAETVLELQKTTHLLLVEHQISKDLQVHTIIVSVKKNMFFYVFIFLLFILTHI